MIKIAESLSQLFKGSQRAHGNFEVIKNRGDGKKQGKAITVKSRYICYTPTVGGSTVTT